MVDVADVGSGMELDLLHLRAPLGLARLLRLDGLFVLELSVVHDLADRRHRIGRNLNKIQPAVLRQPLRIARRHDAEHLSLSIKNANLRNANLVVYTSELSDNPPLVFVLIMPYCTKTVGSCAIWGKDNRSSATSASRQATRGAAPT